MTLATACSGSGGSTSDQQNQDPGPSDGGTQPQPQSCGDTELRVGTGLVHFEPVSDGGTVFLYHGPQGGYMIYISVQAKGIDPGDLMLCYRETFQSDGKEFGNLCWHIMLNNDLGDGWWERVGVWGQINDDYWGHPQLVRGQNIHMDVTLTDTHGCTVKGAYDAYVSLDKGT